MSETFNPVWWILGQLHKYGGSGNQQRYENLQSHSTEYILFYHNTMEV